VWFRFKAEGFFLPAGTDELVDGEAVERFEAFGEVVGVEEGGQMFLQVGMGQVVVGADGGFLEGAVHAFDLAVGPGMVGFGQAVVEVVAGAGVFEGVRPEELARGHGQPDLGHGRTAVARRGEVGAVVRQDRVDPVGDGLDERLEEVGGGPAGGLFHQAGEGEFGGAVDGDKEVETALLGAHLGQVDVEVADGVAFEFLAGGARGLQVWQPADPVALKAAVQGGAGEFWGMEAWRA